MGSCLNLAKGVSLGFSKKLDHTVQGWPASLRDVETSCDTLQEAEKISLGQSITIYAPHQVLSLLDQKQNLRLTAGRMGKYQAIQNRKLSPASLLPESDYANECAEKRVNVYPEGKRTINLQ